MSEKIYVCEWNQKDFSFAEEGLEYCIFKNYDYTYHPVLEQAQFIANMKWRGYAWSKGLIQNQDDQITESEFKQDVQCVSIWVYTDHIASGKYELSQDGWIYSAYCDAWQDDWPEMLALPVPLLD